MIPIWTERGYSPEPVTEPKQEDKGAEEEEPVATPPKRRRAAQPRVETEFVDLTNTVNFTNTAETPVILSDSD